MKISVNEMKMMQLEEVFNPIHLKTTSGEELTIVMRDSGFEFCYQGEMYFAKEGFIEAFHKSSRGNFLVEQKHMEEDVAVCINNDTERNNDDSDKYRLLKLD